MRLTCLLLPLLALPLVSCDSSKKWVGSWSGQLATLWLLPDGHFESREQPVASTKPSTDVYMTGSWTISGQTLQLAIAKKAFVLGDPQTPTAGAIDSTPVTADLQLQGNGEKILCPRLHLPPQSPVGDAPFEMTKLSTAPPSPNWAALEQKINALNSQPSAPPTKSSLPKIINPRGKTFH
ncbi:MAG TPA: hypothetical protein VG944_11485 [Fimbriimonas sp.]|nr:hypothetical protein [Fimbriimonas sp.]